MRAILTVVAIAMFLTGCTTTQSVRYTPRPMQERIQDIRNNNADTLIRLIEKQDHGVISLIRQLEDLALSPWLENEQLREEVNKQAAIIAEQNVALERLTNGPR